MTSSVHEKTFVSTYVISLRDSVDRRVRMEQSLADFSLLKPTWIEAVDGNDISLAEQKTLTKNTMALRFFARRSALTAGEIGCAISHLRCLSTFLKQGGAVGLILEDDAQLCPNFDDKVSFIARFLSNQNKPSACLLSARTTVFGNPVFQQPGLTIFKATDGVGAYAYMVNPLGAHCILDGTLPLANGFDMWWHHRLRGLNLFSAIPHPASFIGSGDDSSLRQERDAVQKADAARRNTLPRFIQTLGKCYDAHRICRMIDRLFLKPRYMPKEWPNMKN